MGPSAWLLRELHSLQRVMPAVRRGGAAAVWQAQMTLTCSQ